MSRHYPNSHEARYWQDPLIKWVAPDASPKVEYIPWFVARKLEQVRKPTPLAVRPCMAITLYTPPVSSIVVYNEKHPMRVFT